ncbi:MAG: LysR family transcriptional regulator [Lachnospiraceae bacterium]|jgi:DNA-binding transcriptional LysR family regulator|nr:LysR family transcriptional regulator [Lachnospiraceae bacterium]MCI8958251.1 LysR family transcriptional regulator [Lachnospiraceae bacterium]
MQLKELRYIVTLADEGSVSRAADRLYMAQSSLSEFLQQYEAELGVSLFVRTSRGVRPTAAGSLFVDNARTILKHYRLVQAQLDDMADLKVGTVIFGISSFRGRHMVPRLLKAFHDKYPGIQVKLVEGNSMALEEMLVEGSLDLAIVALPLTRLTQEPEFLKKDEILLVTHKDHPVMQYARPRENGTGFWVDLKDTAGFEYILSDYDTIMGRIAREEFRKAGIRPPACNTTITADLAASMGRTGIGLAFTYGSCADPMEDVVYLSLGEKGTWLDLALARPYATYQSRAARALAETAKEVL